MIINLFNNLIKGSTCVIYVKDSSQFAKDFEHITSQKIRLVKLNLNDNINEYSVMLDNSNKKQVTHIIEDAPISSRYFTQGDECLIDGDHIRIGGCWFNFDERFIVKTINQQ